MKKLFLSIFALISVASAAQIKGIEHVVLIGSDGFGGFMLRNHADKLPNIAALASRGSSTTQMRSVLPSSSAVNWASILMGAGPELHGYTDWGSKTPDLPSRVTTEHGTFPDLVYMVRKTFPKAEIGVIYNWDGIGYLFDTVGVSKNLLCQTEEQVTSNAVEYLAAKKPKFSFFYLAEPDHTGHTKGWGSKEYIEMCQKIDGYVGRIINGVKAAGMAEKTVIIFIADHGGINTGHGGKSMVEMQVPYIVAGRGVKSGYTIPESMMVFDNAGVISHILGIDMPQVWLARPALSIFR